MKRVHFISTPYAWVTGCGRSTHGWQGPRTPVTSKNVNEVTCMRCLKHLKK